MVRTLRLEIRYSASPSQQHTGHSLLQTLVTLFLPSSLCRLSIPFSLMLPQLGFTDFQVASGTVFNAVLSVVAVAIVWLGFSL